MVRSRKGGADKAAERCPTLWSQPGSVTAARRAEAQDLGSGTQGFLADVLAAALSLPGVSDPRLVRFAAESYWRGETHRLIDRPASIVSLNGSS